MVGKKCVCYIRRGNEVVTVRINSDGSEQYFLHNDTVFNTLWNLLVFYAKNPGLLKLTTGESVELKQPVYCQNSVKERYANANSCLKYNMQRYSLQCEYNLFCILF